MHAELASASLAIAPTIVTDAGLPEFTPDFPCGFGNPPRGLAGWVRWDSDGRTGVFGRAGGMFTTCSRIR